MTVLSFTHVEEVSAEAVSAEAIAQLEQANVRTERWIRYYGPALSIAGMMLYVVFAWMRVA